MAAAICQAALYWRQVRWYQGCPKLGAPDAEPDVGVSTSSFFGRDPRNIGEGGVEMGRGGPTVWVAWHQEVS